MAIDWTASMKQTYEFYIVNPQSGMNVSKLDKVTGATINRDITSDTQVSGSIEYDGELDEVYVRIYLVVEQGTELEKIPLLTMLCQSPSIKYNGKRKTTSITGYSPLIELQNVYPPIGYTIPKAKAGTSIFKLIPDICRANIRCKVLDMYNSDGVYDISQVILTEPIVSDPQKSWFELVNELLQAAGYFARVDEFGVVYFSKKQQISKMTPIWTFDVNNSSILSQDISIDRDLYGIPNVVEVVTVCTDGNTINCRAINNDISSPVSVASRGREVVRRLINPESLGKITSDSQGQDMLLNYAYEQLEEASTLQYTVSYSHGYCGVNIGDCVRINYPAAGIINEKAYVINQKISCKTGCTVEETARFTKKLFERK